jgi:PEP-CTERM/exosortase A-associated glycosyltransferase
MDTIAAKKETREITAQGGLGPLRVLHVMDHSWPVLSGYAIRSRNLVAAQRRLGFAPSALTGPLHQLDDAGGKDAVADEILYLRTSLSEGAAGRTIRRGWPFFREVSVVRLLRRRIGRLLERSSFEVIHAHSPALCGLAAWQAAHSRRLPFVYEIRAFWEDAAADQKKTRPGGLRYELSRIVESYVVRRADAVVGIAKHILEDLRRRGVPEERLFHIPNGVEADRFPPRPRDRELAVKLGLDGAPVFGFIGSLYRYEGISWLVGALAEMRRRALPVKLLVVGDGEDFEEIRRAVRETASEGQVILAGRVHHDAVERYYSVMDVLVYPRLSVRLTELTTPLKPLEAMAQAKPVLASNVGGIRELVEDEQTGLLFQPGDIEGFCRQAERLMRSEPFRRELGERARGEVLEKKDWKVLARRYEAVYDYAIGRHARAQ